MGALLDILGHEVKRTPQAIGIVFGPFDSWEATHGVASWPYAFWDMWACRCGWVGYGDADLPDDMLQRWHDEAAS